MIITVIGGGNGAFAAVTDLTLQGHELRWWRRRAGAGQKTVTLHDHQGATPLQIEGFDDIAAALSGSALILVPLPANAQADVARRLAPHLVAGQVVIAMPGNLGAWTMKEAAKQQRPDLPDGVIFAETGALPWITRKTAEDAVMITTRATLTTLAALPASGGAQAAELLYKALPQLKIDLRQDLLDVALTNGNASLHTPLVLMNAGTIARAIPFEPHGEGTQAPIRAVQDALDAERIAIREHLGLPAPHYPLADFYGPGTWYYDRLGQDLPQIPPPAHEQIDFTQHRYVVEDIAIGLAMLVALADQLGLNCPLSKGFLAQAEAICGKSLSPAPRGPGAEGLPQSPAEALKLLRG